MVWRGDDDDDVGIFNLKTYVISGWVVVVVMMVMMSSERFRQWRQIQVQGCKSRNREILCMPLRAMYEMSY